MNPRVTLRTLAKKLGVSHVTVSLALRDHPRISAEVRERIKATAEKLGYAPAPFLSALSKYSKEASANQVSQANLAWLSFEPTHRGQEVLEHYKGARETALRCGYRLRKIRITPRTSGQDLHAKLQKLTITGLLIPPGNEHLRADLLDWNLYAAIVFGHSHPELPFHIAANDQAAAGRLGYKSISARGYKRIGLVMEDASLANTFFASGFLQEQVFTPAGKRIRPFFLPSQTPQRHPDLLGAWLKRTKPEALLSNMAQLPALLRDLGYDIPGKLGFASTSVLDGNATAGINQNAEEIGRVATETLISLINGQQRGFPTYQRQILVEGFWVDGSDLPAR